jgi:predicted nuclease of predicted toxin-antitoxin system
MRLLVDVCLSVDWIAFLGERGVEAVHWSSVGSRSADDEVIFAHAAEHGYVIFTHDLDFGTLLAMTAARVPSVIQARVDDTSVSAIGEAVVDLVQQCAEPLSEGAIVTLMPDRIRVRILPI